MVALTALLTLWALAVAVLGRKGNYADNNKLLEEAVAVDPGAWLLVSQGRPVTVHPPSATCGLRRHESNTGRKIEFGHGIKHGRQADSLLFPLPRDLDVALRATDVSGDVTAAPLLCTGAPCPGRRAGGVRLTTTGRCVNGTERCVVNLDTVGCPSRYTVTFWVRSGQSTSHRIFLESDDMQIVYVPSPGLHLRWRKVTAKIDVVARHALLYEDGVPFRGTPEPEVSFGHTPRMHCVLNVIQRGIGVNHTTDLTGITVDHVGDNRVKSNLHATMSNGSDGGGAFPQCACPESHPVPDAHNAYRCLAAGKGGASVWSPSVGIPAGLVLVEPRVVVDSLLQPYYWVSAAWVRSFSLTIHLERPTEVGRVRVMLLTPPPGDRLTIESEANGRWQTWCIFSYKCPQLGSRDPCLQPPSMPLPAGPGVAAAAAGLWLLDTATGGARGRLFPAAATTRLRLVFSGLPHLAAGTGAPPPARAHHVIAEVQAFSPVSGNAHVPAHAHAHARGNKRDQNMKWELELERKRKRKHLQEDPNGSVTELRRVLAQARADADADADARGRRPQHETRARRAVMGGSPVVVHVYPPYAPANGSLVYLLGRGFGMANASVTVGNIPCVCTPRVLESPLLDAVSCNNDTLLICEVGSGEGVIGQVLPVTIVTTNGTSSTPSENNTFTFKPNPEIATIYPYWQYVPGGRRITISGMNLDSGLRPKMRLTTYIDVIRNPYIYDDPLDSEVCDTANSTVIYCTSPPANVPKSYLWKRRKRSVLQTLDKYLNDDALTVRISVFIGGYKIDNEKIMYISKQPKYQFFQNSIFDLKYYEEPGNPSITIQGDRFINAADAADYTVTVGGAPCQVTSLSQTAVVCTPPQESDILPSGPVNNDGYPRVSIRVFNLPAFNPGVVRYFYSQPVDTTSLVVGVIAAIGIILIAIIVCVIVKLRMENKHHKKREMVLSEQYTNLVRDERSLLQSVNKELRKKLEACRLDSAMLSRNREIGSGNYAKVYMGRISMKSNNNHVNEFDVAVKTIKDDTITLRQLEDFLEEAMIMKAFSHNNVLNLIGVTIEKDRPFVVLPLMSNGDLKEYVSNEHRTFKVDDYLRLLVQVADGMAYVAGLGVIHRDLRAVNCMINDKVIVKVGDFGLARWSENEYYKINDKERPLPLKWMSPENIQGSKFSTFSDVWAYGIVMWEVMTHGSAPFRSFGRMELKNHLLAGGQLKKPKNCPDNVYSDLMQPCWNLRYRKRPSFTELAQRIRRFLNLTDTHKVSPQVQEAVSGTHNGQNQGKHRKKTENSSGANEPAHHYLQVIPPVEYENDNDGGYVQPSLFSGSDDAADMREAVPAPPPGGDIANLGVPPSSVERGVTNGGYLVMAGLKPHEQAAQEESEYLELEPDCIGTDPGRASANPMLSTLLKST